MKTAIHTEFSHPPSPLDRGRGEAIDIVIPLGNGSQWQDNELRYALRSIEKYAKNYRNIVIVGNKPAWLTNVFHIPLTESHTERSRSVNILNKIIAACKNHDVTKEFLFTNDDIFLVEEIDCTNYHFIHKGYLSESTQRRDIDPDYRVQLTNTSEALKKQGLTTFNFDTHCPIIYDKLRFIKKMKQYDWSINQGYGIKSLYANTEKITGSFCPDLKFNAAYSNSELTMELITHPGNCFSIGDYAINSHLKKLLNDLYPSPSKYELTNNNK